MLRASIATASSNATVKKELDSMRKKDLFLLLAETFQALGDSSRIQIVWALSKNEQCVGDLAKILDMSQPSISHHLRTLRNLRLVRVRKNGRQAYYALDDEHIDHLLTEGLIHVADFARNTGK